MNLNHLEYAAAVARFGSISRASKELYVSQPYLSGIIKSLEAELDFQIFERTTSGMEPTDLGRAFLTSADKILQELEVIRHLRQERDQSLVLASYFSPFFMKCFLSFREAHGAQPQDSIYEMDLPDSFRALEEGRVNLSLICYGSDVREKYWEQALRSHCVCTELFHQIPLHIIMRQGHPLEGREGISTKDLFDYPFVCYRDTLSFLQALQLSTHPNLLLVSDRGSYLDALSNGDYLSIMAIVAKGGPARQDMRYVPLLGNAPKLDFAYAVRKEYRLHSREREFIKFIKNSGI